MKRRAARSGHKHIVLLMIACNAAQAACSDLKGDHPTGAGQSDGASDASFEGEGGADADIEDASTEDGVAVSTRNGDADARDTDAPPSADADAGPDGPPEDAEDGPVDGAAEDADVGTDGDGAPPANPCNADCSERGAARCASTSQVQICANLNGCLQWVDVGACPTASICCAGSCATIDSANCHGCGVTCSGVTPSCSPDLKKCVCTDAACATNGRLCNAATGVCDPAVPPPPADYYVEAKAPAGGDGTLLKPFRTITAATAAARAAGLPKSIYVMPGTYDDALGEHFPLIARGVSIQGAGADKTILVGAGEFDHSAGGGYYNGQYWATFVAGDPLLPSRIAGLSVRPTWSGVAKNHLGVLCDSGSASGAVTAPAGQTVIDGANIGPGFHVAVAAATSAGPPITGCNLKMTASTLTGGWVGLHASGCGVGTGSSPVVVDIGGDTASSGNVMSDMQLPDAGWGVVVHECVKRGAFRHNLFTTSDYGVSIDQRAEGPGGNHLFTFQHNRFEHLSRAGLLVNGFSSEGSAVIDELSDNSFIDISAGLTNDIDHTGYGLIIDIFNIIKARRNTFIGNDIGIYFNIDTSAWRAGDFGTATDPGNNVFRCNSSITGTPGADIEVGNSGAGTIRLAGNFWDHATPTVQSTNVFSDGVDIALTAGPFPIVDTANAGLATAACPAGRVSGP